MPDLMLDVLYPIWNELEKGDYPRAIRWADEVKDEAFTKALNQFDRELVSIAQDEHYWERTKTAAKKFSDAVSSLVSQYRQFKNKGEIQGFFEQLESRSR